jgi:CRP-like cAMP-binding protein
MTDTTTQEIIQILRRCEVSLGLSDDDLAKIAALPSIRIEIYETGVTISNEGEPARDLYILVDGRVDLRMRIHFELGSPAREITVDAVTKGSVFGWSALVRPYLLTKTSVSAEESKALVISGKELIELMESDKHIGYEIMQNIASVVASRLRIPNAYFWAESLRRRRSSSPSQD